jgi:hypothetical protein
MKNAEKKVGAFFDDLFSEDELNQYSKYSDGAKATTGNSPDEIPEDDFMDAAKYLAEKAARARKGHKA